MLGEPPPIPRPTVNVRVHHDDLDIQVRALIDTGAPTTLFHRPVADAIGFELGRSPRRTQRVQILGGSHLAEFANVSLTLPPFNDIT